MIQTATPRTDAIPPILFREKGAQGATVALRELARELERENARLRVALTELADATEAEAKATFWTAASGFTVRSFNARQAARAALEAT